MLRIGGKLKGLILTLALLMGMSASAVVNVLPVETPKIKVDPIPAKDPVKTEPSKKEEPKSAENLDTKKEKEKLPSEVGSLIKSLAKLLGFDIKNILDSPELQKFLQNDKMGKSSEKKLEAIQELIQRALQEQWVAMQPVPNAPVKMDPNVILPAPDAYVENDRIVYVPIPGGIERQGHGGHTTPGGPSPRPQMATRPEAHGHAPLSNVSVPTNEIMPANIRGNPAMGIVSDLGYGKMGKCQAWLFHSSNKAGDTQCSLGTAGHCLVNEYGQVAQRFFTRYGEISIPPFQSSGDRVIVDRGRGVNKDNAAIQFSGETCLNMIQNNVQTVPICANPPVPGDIVRAGIQYSPQTIMGRIEDYDSYQGISVNFRTTTNEGYTQFGVHTGDSGGPSMVWQNSAWCLLGPLSQASEAATTHSVGGRATIGSHEAFYSDGRAFFQNLLRSSTEGSHL